VSVAPAKFHSDVWLTRDEPCAFQRIKIEIVISWEHKLMKQQTKWFANAMALAGSLAMVSSAVAATTITTFDNFNLTGLFGWSDATVVSGPTSYSITDTGYGSGYYDINPNINASGGTTLEVTLSLSGASAADGLLGPIVSLVDGDGTMINFPWYGQTLGSHVLTADLTAYPALDLSTLDFFHLQLDPSSYAGTYTVEWQNLRIITVPEPSVMVLLGIGAAGCFIARRRLH
jgi:hypothetical protein